jgi:hypothetical protein
MGEQRKGEGSRRINQFVGRRGSKKRAKDEGSKGIGTGALYRKQGEGNG